MAGSDNNNSDLYVAAASLAVAFVALFGTILQVLQQYYASAAAVANCRQQVMGEWHQSTKRKIKPFDFRLEVRFEAPVLFVSPANNRNGPIQDVPIHYVTGDEASQIATRSRIPPAKSEQDQDQNKNLLQETATGLAAGLRRRRRAASSLLPFTNSHSTTASNENKSGRGRSRSPAVAQVRGATDGKGGIHTADNEKATWVTMLIELQRMENESENWQQGELMWHADQNLSRGTRLPPVFEQRTLAVAVQAKMRSMDNMPANVKRPYATTTIAHLVEMTAMLGLYWKEFDRSSNRYRAEGNGYMLTGVNVPDLGVLFAFQKCGMSKFRENRIVPVTWVKEFVFGMVPTIFRSQADEDERRLNFPAEEPRDMRNLFLGSNNEMAETVASFGCNTRTATMFLDDDKKHGHLFPIAFELVGMLAKTLYVPNSSFRMLPNPTFYHWDNKFFNLPSLVEQFERVLRDDNKVMPNGASAPQMEHICEMRIEVRKVRRALKKWAGEKKSGIRTDNEFTLDLCDVLYAAINWCDEYLTGPITAAIGPPPPRTTQQAQQGQQQARSAEEIRLPPDPDKKRMVNVVLREHVQAIMRVVNLDADANAPPPPYAQQQPSQDNSPTTGERRGSGNPPALDTQRPRQQQWPIDRLGKAAPETRPKVLMEIYFDIVLPAVIDGADDYNENNAADATGGMSPGLSPTSSAAASPVLGPTDPPPLPQDSSSSVPPTAPQTAPLPAAPNGPTPLQLHATTSAPPALHLSPPSTSTPPTAAAVAAAAAAAPQQGQGGRGHSRTQSDIQGQVVGTDPKLDAVRATNIWCTMIFRMLCWLTLHDFHKNDRQVSSKSEVWGSRLPVYIS